MLAERHPYDQGDSQKNEEAELHAARERHRCIATLQKLACDGMATFGEDQDHEAVADPACGDHIGNHEQDDYARAARKRGQEASFDVQCGQ